MFSVYLLLIRSISTLIAIKMLTVFVQIGTHASILVVSKNKCISTHCSTSVECANKNDILLPILKLCANSNEYGIYLVTCISKRCYAGRAYRYLSV